jgi:hypothetical protein
MSNVHILVTISGHATMVPCTISKHRVGIQTRFIRRREVFASGLCFYALILRTLITSQVVFLDLMNDVLHVVSVTIGCLARTEGIQYRYIRARS